LAYRLLFVDMLKVLALCLAAQAVAEDYTGTPFRWPDMLRNGGRIVQILDSENTPKPAEWNYPKWYKKYPMRFVQEIPTPPGPEVAGGELVILEYDITDKMGLGSDNLQKAANALGSLGSFMMNKFSPKHNELGLIAKDKSGKELGRYVFSLWPIGNDEIEDLSKDLRQRPREYNDTQLITKNRAVTSIELSKANTWWGLPSDTKQIHVSNLNRQGYFKALQSVKDFADNHQYFNDYEITFPDGKVAMPAVTCNSLIEHVVQVSTNQKAFDEGLGKMGYLALNVAKAKAAKFSSVPTKRVIDLMQNKKMIKDHYNKDMYIVPAYYDPSGKPLASGTSETPEQWYVVWTSGVNWRQNYMKAEKFQQKMGIKKGSDVGMNMRQLLDYEPVVGEVEQPKPQAQVKGAGKKGKKNMLKKK
jgi:hypothetical protein